MKTAIVRPAILCVLALVPAIAQKTVNPTFLRGSLNTARQATSEYTSDGCQFRVPFSSPRPAVMKGISRFGELVIRPGAASSSVVVQGEELAIFVRSGAGTLRYGQQDAPLRAGDFAYIAPAKPHSFRAGASELRVLVMGFQIRTPGSAPEPRFEVANLSEVRKQVVGNHPPSTLYQLMIGGRDSTRDRIAGGLVLTSLFLMEMTPGGTNQPHHHDREEEIYVVLEGDGDMVAGGGLDGLEGRYPAKAGDVFFIRLNATVGFYSNPARGSAKARILAVRSLYPFSR